MLLVQNLIKRLQLQVIGQGHPSQMLNGCCQVRIILSRGSSTGLPQWLWSLNTLLRVYAMGSDIESIDRPGNGRDLLTPNSAEVDRTQE
ncbi:hypothetical protein VNO78_10338 [Psophocarpus tetragonolobus]|uniref:Uncharacterized protein n=1 Tax=Psophocarpus tetragonolobus TaxID=3891 RepID=A0AAN9SJX9_PSOTE